MSVAQSTANEVVASGVTAVHLGRQRRRYRRIHLISLVAVDLFAANLAFALAYAARYLFELGGDVPGESFVAYQHYVPVQLLFVALCVFGYQLRGTYALPRGASIATEAASVMASSAVAAMAVFALVVLVRYPATSRLIFIYAWILAVVLGIALRYALRLARGWAHQRGLAGEQVLVVGNNHLARMIMQMAARETHLGYRIAGFVDDAARADFGRFRSLGGVHDLPDIIQQQGVEHVIVALPASQHREILWVLDRCAKAGVSVSLVPDLFELRLSHVSLETVGGIPLFGLQETPISGWNHVVKRAMDVALAAVFLVLAAPWCGLIALAIKLNSTGPVLFSQTRLGKGGVPFNFYKFRSMRVGAHLEQQQLEAMNEADGPVFKMRADPRITRVGRFIRRTSLDEIPQFWHVLRGEMSLVGPRPPIPEEVDRYEEWQRRRLEVVPGITGLWQVSGRSELSFDEWVMLDIVYIDTWSLGLDLQILARTLPAVLRRAGAY